LWARYGPQKISEVIAASSGRHATRGRTLDGKSTESKGVQNNSLEFVFIDLLLNRGRGKEVDGAAEPLDLQFGVREESCRIVLLLGSGEY